MQENERGTFDAGFEVTEDDIATANKPPKPWDKGTKATATVTAFVKADKTDKNGAEYFQAAFDAVREDGAKKPLRDGYISLAAKSKGRFVQFCQCFGLGKMDEINAVRRCELSLVGLSGEITVGQEEGDDGNTYNRVSTYRKPKIPF